MNRPIVYKILRIFLAVLVIPFGIVGLVLSSSENAGTAKVAMLVVISIFLMLIGSFGLIMAKSNEAESRGKMKILYNLLSLITGILWLSVCFVDRVRVVALIFSMLYVLIIPLETLTKRGKKPVP